MRKNQNAVKNEKKETERCLCKMFCWPLSNFTKVSLNASLLELSGFYVSVIGFKAQNSAPVVYYEK